MRIADSQRMQQLQPVRATKSITLKVDRDLWLDATDKLRRAGIPLQRWMVGPVTEALREAASCDVSQLDALCWSHEKAPEGHPLPETPRGRSTPRLHSRRRNGGRSAVAGGPSSSSD